MATTLVRYISPFGSPAWMSPEAAQRLLIEDDSLWLYLQEVEAETGHRVTSEHQRQIGAPRIEGR